jgi:hypothetical protein
MKYIFVATKMMVNVVSFNNEPPAVLLTFKILLIIQNKNVRPIALTAKLKLVNSTANAT